MQSNLNSNEGYDKKNISKSVFQVGFFLSITGIILLIIGMSSVSLFQINYQTDSKIVMTIVCCIGIALILMALGNNYMIHEGKIWVISRAIGFLLACTSIVIFMFNYENNWFYPLISYILILYVMGLILLMENNLWILPISLVSSWIYHLNFLVREKTIKDADNNYVKDGLAKQKLSFLDVIDEIPYYQISSMKDMFYETESGSYPSVNEGEELNNNTNFKLDDSLRRRLEVYQLMQEK